MVHTELQPRARRYPIVTTLRFRREGDDTWRSAWTLDMSRTGVRFSHEGPALDRTAGIEFVFALPILAARSGFQVRCMGRVARVEPAEPRRGSWTVAVTADEYEFLGRPQD